MLPIVRRIAPHLSNNYSNHRDTRLARPPSMNSANYVHKYQTPTKGTVREYLPRLQVFEFESGSSFATNAVLFIGGLTDGLLTVPYLPKLADSLPEGWSLYQILFSSSYSGWATGSLDRDCKEIGKCVEFLKEKLGKTKIVLFGNSTGCQDSIHYILTQKGEGIDGAVLHSPVSDRFAVEPTFNEMGLKLEDYNQEAREWRDKYGKDAVLPPKFASFFFDTPITAYRWLSLFELGGDDDYFSEDLSDEQLQKTFGVIEKPMLVLYSGNDEFVPEKVDKKAIVQRWASFAPEKYFSKHSKVVLGSTHQLDHYSKDGAFESLVESTEKFLADL